IRVASRSTTASGPPVRASSSPAATRPSRTAPRGRRRRGAGSVTTISVIKWTVSTNLVLWTVSTNERNHDDPAQPAARTQRAVRPYLQPHDARPAHHPTDRGHLPRPPGRTGGRPRH